jgi:hypothetical protein
MSKESIVKVQEYVLGDFIGKILSEFEKGYAYDATKTLKIGGLYYTVMELSGDSNLVVQTVKASEIGTGSSAEDDLLEEDVVDGDTLEEGSESDKAATVELAGKTEVPDWSKLGEYVLSGDKDAIEAEGLRFGVDLSRRKTASNMVKDLRDHVGA